MQRTSIVLAVALAAPAAAHDRAALEPRLERLGVKLESRREAHHIPGMALAIVAGDEVVLLRGFEGEPVWAVRLDGRWTLAARHPAEPPPETHKSSPSVRECPCGGRRPRRPGATGVHGRR